LPVDEVYILDVLMHFFKISYNNAMGHTKWINV